MAKKFDAHYSDALLLKYAYGMLCAAKSVQNGEAPAYFTNTKWLNNNRTMDLIEARINELREQGK